VDSFYWLDFFELFYKYSYHDFKSPCSFYFSSFNFGSYNFSSFGLFNLGSYNAFSGSFLLGSFPSQGLYTPFELMMFIKSEPLNMFGYGIDLI
jgi:hypothetical protein